MQGGAHKKIWGDLAHCGATFYLHPTKGPRFFKIRRLKSLKRRINTVLIFFELQK